MPETVTFPPVKGFEALSSDRQMKYIYAALREENQDTIDEQGADHYVPTSANVTAVDSTILAALATRAGTTLITNTGVKDAWLNLGAAAVANKGIKLPAGGTVGISSAEWKGSIHAICAATESTTVAIEEGTSAP